MKIPLYIVWTNTDDSKQICITKIGSTWCWTKDSNDSEWIKSDFSGLSLRMRRDQDIKTYKALLKANQIIKEYFSDEDFLVDYFDLALKMGGT